jgi:uncharacterized membrane protein YgcG
MRRLLPIGLLVAGLAFPLGLALAVYVTSARSLAGVPAGVTVPTGTIGRPNPSPVTTTTTEAQERRPDRCQEAEHRTEPACGERVTTRGSTSTSEDDSRSGRRSGDDDGSGSRGRGSSGSDDSSGGSGSSGSGRGRSGDDD